MVFYVPVRSRSKQRPAHGSVWVQIWPYAVITTVLLVIVSVMFWSTKGEETRMSNYWTIVAAVGTLFVLATLVIADLRDEQARREADTESFVRGLQENLFELEKQFAADPDLVRLHKQMYPEIRQLASVPDPPTTPQMKAKEVSLALQMLQMIENINLLTSKEPQGWHNPARRTWILYFESWMHAPIIREVWEDTRSGWAPETVNFIEHILPDLAQEAEQSPVVMEKK